MGAVPGFSAPHSKSITRVGSEYVLNDEVQGLPPQGGEGRERASTVMQIRDIADICQPASGVRGLRGFLAVLD